MTQRHPAEQDAATRPGAQGLRQRLGLWAGPLLFAAVMLMPLPEGLSPEGRGVLAATIWIATWWMTEAIPIPATSLLPVVLLPLFAGMAPGDVTPAYGNPLIFVFLGGFLLALAIERWNLHRRIALRIILLLGGAPRRIVLGFMVATGFLSMWISNTAATMMMVPMGIAVVSQLAAIHHGRVMKISGAADLATPAERNFAVALMLGTAYGASVGGIATLIGTPPNLVFAGMADELAGRPVAFSEWLLVGLPFAVLGLPLVWLYLTRLAYPFHFEGLSGARVALRQQLKGLGPMTTAEKRVLAVFAGMAGLWIVRTFLITPWLPFVEDSTIAIAGGVTLFLVASGRERGERLMDWNTAARLPWGVILLFGGGLAIAAGFQQSGLAAWIGQQLAVAKDLAGLPLMLLVTGPIVFLTELTSNTATTNIMLPIVHSLEAQTGMPPLSLMAAATISASCAFMLPVATPPNAIVFGSGFVTLPQMARAGFWLNLFFIWLVATLGYFWVPRALPPPQVVEIHLKLSDEASGTPEERDRLAELGTQLGAAVARRGTGQLDRHEVGGGYSVLYFSGASADALAEELAPLLREAALLSGSYLVKRRWKSAEPEERLELR